MPKLQWKWNKREVESWGSFLLSFTTTVTSPHWFVILGLAFIAAVLQTVNLALGGLALIALLAYLFYAIDRGDEHQIIASMLSFFVYPLLTIWSMGDYWGAGILTAFWAMLLFMAKDHFAKAWQGPELPDKLEHFVLYFLGPILLWKLGAPIYLAVVVSIVINALYELVWDGFGLERFIHNTGQEGASLADFIAGLIGTLLALLIIALNT